MPQRLSGLQVRSAATLFPPETGAKRDVLHFYRRVQREARQKDPQQRQLLLEAARDEFRRHSTVDAKNYQLIEHLLRKGRKQLESLRTSMEDKEEYKHPRTPDAILEDYTNRRSGLLRALTTELDEFYMRCDPERENLCLYGLPTGNWQVDLPAEQVPSELPEPTLGINFARDGMPKADWLALVAAHSDSWLISVAFYFGFRLGSEDRRDLFRGINAFPTLHEVVTADLRNNGNKAPPSITKKKVRGAVRPLSSGRLLQHRDINPDLKGRQAEMYWPDDQMWYLVEIHSVSLRNRSAKVRYSSGEFEELNLEDIIQEGHMSLITH